MRLSSWLLTATLVIASQAFAQKVVILEIDGDVGHKLRAQIEAAASKQEGLEVVPLETFKTAAAGKKLKGGAAMTAVGVSRVAKVLPLDAAVGGEILGSTYKVLIYDRAGESLWTKDLPLKKGLLTDDFAKKLARAISAAAAQAAEKASTVATGPASDPGGPAGPGTSGPGASGKTDPNTMPEVDLSEPTTTGPSRHPIDSGGSTTGPSSSDDPDADAEARAARKRVKVPLFRIAVTGTTTWRSQCLRPGVTACKEYDALAVKPEGVTINFGSTVPYLGFAANGELFPLARFDNRVAQGFGVVGGFHYGSSLTKIVEMTSQGNGPEKLVTSTDIGWHVQATWRFHFNVGLPETLTDAEGVVTEIKPVGFVGLRGGVMGRNFLIDPAAMLPFPSSERTAPTGFGFGLAGLDVSIPVATWFRIEAGGSIFFNPRPGPDQIIGYGNLNDETGGATATGFSIEGGFAGDIWGPLGWQVRLRYVGFADRYYGQGQKWTVCNNQQCGGAGEESFTTINWGLTVAY